MSKYPPFAVVAADTNEAHIYVFKRGKTIEQEDIANIKTNRTLVGGWSQMRYQGTSIIFTSSTRRKL